MLGGQETCYMYSFWQLLGSFGYAGVVALKMETLFFLKCLIGQNFIKLEAKFIFIYFQYYFQCNIFLNVFYYYFLEYKFRFYSYETGSLS